MHKYNKIYYVYIVTNKYDKVLYVGVTNNLERRVFEHKRKEYPKSFTAKYNLKKLLYFEDYNDVNVAIAREKQLKGWLRNRKLELIKSQNPQFKDLFEE